jgi:hypothetical protein
MKGLSTSTADTLVADQSDAREASFATTMQSKNLSGIAEEVSLFNLLRRFLLQPFPAEVLKGGDSLVDNVATTAASVDY